MASRINWRFWEQERGGCAAIEPLLSLYVDHMASAAETRRVETHLAECAACRQALQWMQATHQVIARRPIVAPPADMSLRIAQAIAAAQAGKAAPARPAPRRSLAFRPALAYGFSFALIAAVSGAVFLTAGHHEVPPGQIARVTPRPTLAPLPVVHPSSSGPVASIPKTSLPVHHARPIALPSVIAVKSPTALVKPHLPPIAVPPPETVAVKTDESPLPTPIKIHITVPPTHAHAAPTDEPNPLLARGTPSHADGSIPTKATVTPHSSASPGVQIIANVPHDHLVPDQPDGTRVVVEQPVITPQPVHVATASLSLNEQLRASVDKMGQAPITASEYEEHSAVDGLASAASGTVDLVHAPVH